MEPVAAAIGEGRGGGEPQAGSAVGAAPASLRRARPSRRLIEAGWGAVGERERGRGMGCKVGPVVLINLFQRTSGLETKNLFSSLSYLVQRD